MPPSMPPRLDFSASSTLREASLTAATTRSCNISISPDFTTSGSMTMLCSCFWPLMRTVTLPPPDDASMVICCIFSCSFSACWRACESMSCKLNPSMKPYRPSAAILLIDHGTNLCAELLLHPLHDGIVHRATAGTGPVCRPWRRIGCRLRRCRHAAAHHLKLQRLGRQIVQRCLDDPLGFGS